MEYHISHEDANLELVKAYTNIVTNVREQILELNKEVPKNTKERYRIRQQRFVLQNAILSMSEDIDAAKRGELMICGNPKCKNPKCGVTWIE